LEAIAEFTQAGGLSHTPAREDLLGLPGVGPWTADCILLRAFADPDAFPEGDLALRAASGLSGPALLRAVEPVRPFRAYAATLLWLKLTLEVNAHEDRLVPA